MSLKRGCFEKKICSLCTANQTRKFGSHHETSGHGPGAEAVLISNGNDDEYVMLKDATTTVNDISKSILTVEREPGQWVGAQVVNIVSWGFIKSMYSSMGVTCS